MPSEELTAMRSDIRELTAAVRGLVASQANGKPEAASEPKRLPPPPPPPKAGTFDEEALYQRFKQRFLSEVPLGSGAPLVVTPPEKLRKDFQREEADRIIAASRSLTPLAKRVLKLLETTSDYVSQPKTAERLGRSNSGNAAVTLAKAIGDLRECGFVDTKPKTGSRTAVRDKIAADLAFYQASQADVDQVYQTVLHEIATGPDE